MLPNRISSAQWVSRKRPGVRVRLEREHNEVGHTLQLYTPCDALALLVVKVGTLGAAAPFEALDVHSNLSLETIRLDVYRFIRVRVDGGEVGERWASQDAKAGHAAESEENNERVTGAREVYL